MRGFLFFGLLGLFSSGCGPAALVPSSDDPVGIAVAAQIDPGSKTSLTQGGALVAAAWRGTISTGEDVEYWVTLPNYSAAGARSYSTASSSCAEFKRTVCRWRGATHFRGVFTQTRLDGSLPPGPCTPPRDGVALLGPGTWRTVDAAGAEYAATFVSGACEYWAMSHDVTAHSIQSRSAVGYPTLSDFQEAMVNPQPSPPHLWYAVSYQPFASFCAVPSC